MTSYRLFLWSRGENRLRERHVVTDAADVGEGLLDTFDRIGRCALIAEERLPAADPIVPEPRPARPGKLARARRHLLAARRLLEDMGETVLAARAAAPLDEIDRRGKARARDAAHERACLLPRLPA